MEREARPHKHAQVYVKLLQVKEGKTTYGAHIFGPISAGARPGGAARVTASPGRLTQGVDVQLDAEGRPTEMSFLRWSNANSERKYRLQPFGGIPTDFREVQGFRLPFNVEVGNMFGTAD